MKRRFDGSSVRLLGVSSLNSGRANARPFFFVRRHRAVSNIVGRVSPRLDTGKNGDLSIDRRKIGARRVEQLVEVVDNEIRLLVTIDVVVGPHNPPQVEADAVRTG